jgi:hypothetical protein
MVPVERPKTNEKFAWKTGFTGEKTAYFNEY